MTQEQWSLVETHFDALREASAAEQQVGLNAIPDDEVRREVQSLLEHSGGGETIAQAVGAVAAQIEDQSDAASQVQDRRVGPYKLVRRVGQGGQGAVFEAVRDDGTFHQRVAIKIVKWEMDSDASRERFRQERQILAGLEHPYIARLLDGGETEDGTPYLVMEFVEGQPLTVAASGWPLRRKLELFLKVCEALEHAHRNLVIHRDLKPANILVTAAGEPKLLDFGIAKLIDPAATKTQTGLAALTPEYASPEQVRGQAISTSSDVYSLGVVLYQLLTSRKPYTLDTTSPFEMDRVICVQAPVPPGLGDELDHILLMALRKEPERRYGSVERFAEDIERYLNNEPVRARPDTAWYRTRKYVRRHWVGLAAASAALLGICVGAGIAIYQARIAQERFQQVRKLANTFLFQFHDEIVDIPGTTKARALVVKTGLEYLDNLSKSAGGDLELQEELAKAYQKVGNVQGFPNTASLGDTKGAGESYERAAALYEQLVKRDSKYAIDAIDCLRRLAFIRIYQQRFGEARATIQKALQQTEPLRALHSVKALNLMAVVSDTAAEIDRVDSKPVEFIAQARQALAYREEWAKLLPQEEGSKGVSEVAVSHLRLGRGLLTTGELHEAAREMELCLRGLDQVLRVEPRNVTYLRNHLATLLSLREVYGSGTLPSLEQWDKASQYGRLAVDASRQMMEADVHEANVRMNHAVALIGLAYTLSKAGGGLGTDEARRGVAAWHELALSGKVSEFDRNMAVNNLRLIVPLVARANHAEGLSLAQEVIGTTRRMLTGEPPESDSYWYLSDALISASAAYLEGGKRDEARRHLSEAVAVTKPFIDKADQSVPTAIAAANLFRALEEESVVAAKCAEAREIWTKEVALWRPLAPKSEYPAMRLKRAEASPPASCNGAQ